MENIRINSVGLYHPENKVLNEHYINHFDKQGKDIRRLLEAFGREERYIINDENENGLTMAIKASQDALNKANLKGDDIDVIFYSCLIPEYTMPPQAVIIHNAIKGKSDCLVMDTNVNCVGMIVAVDNAVRYLKTNKNFKRALIVGSDCMSVHCREDDELTYPQFGDLACAVIIEKTEEDCDFYGSKYITNSDKWDIVKYPSCGNKDAYKYDNGYDRQIKWTPFDGGHIIEHAKNGMNSLLAEIDLTMSDINIFCISQYALGIKTGCVEAFGVREEQIPYVGHKYGYTGTTSPFLALYDSIENGDVKRGDYVGLWSVGTNWTTCSVIFKY